MGRLAAPRRRRCGAGRPGAAACGDSYHDLRHTVATAMAATGNAALATLQLGHASASTTEAAYINRAGDVDNSAIIEAFAADALAIFGG